ncbi:MAG TPA: hypothetical protein VE445_02915 [Nitrososphaeraceae archaeon]|jgi:hypothetical protein|nr:hypothetical protein [Nitrososphaeraceae archaeon]
MIKEALDDLKKSELKREQSDKERGIFPKKVGIIFMERYPRRRVGWIHPKEPRLDFDQLACSHLLLQLNGIQSLFDFRVIHKDVKKKPEGSSLHRWFEHTLINEFRGKKFGEASIDLWDEIDLWIAITSEAFSKSQFFGVLPKSKSDSGKNMAVITSNYWKKVHSPPSVFEYICISSIICGLHFLSLGTKLEDGLINLY